MKPEISHGESYRVESRGNSMPVFSCHLVSESMVLRSLHSTATRKAHTRLHVQGFFFMGVGHVVLTLVTSSLVPPVVN